MADISLQKRTSNPNMHDQEKLDRIAHLSAEHRQHNVSPSQKRALLRWQQKGKEKSSIALACTWVVDHQIGKNPGHRPDDFLSNPNKVSQPYR